MKSKGQVSVDLLIAVSIMVLTITMASYYVISAFVPYSGRDIDLQASAYRVAMILSEDGGLWSVGPNLLESNWAERINMSNPEEIRLCLKRIGLANTSTTYLTKLSYEVKIPCYLNRTKVELFFNYHLWNKTWNSTSLRNKYDNCLDYLATLIGLNSTVKRYRYNISICYMNGSTVYDQNIGRNLTIGYPLYVDGEFIPKEFGKFERIIVFDQYENGEWFDRSKFSQDPPKYLRRLIAYVW